jgi:hypothetical protein
MTFITSCTNNYFWERIQKNVFILLNSTKKSQDLGIDFDNKCIVFLNLNLHILKVKFFKGGDTFQHESTTKIPFYKNFIPLILTVLYSLRFQVGSLFSVL